MSKPHGKLNETHWHIFLVAGDLDVNGAVFAEYLGDCGLKLNLVMLAVQTGIVMLKSCSNVFRWDLLGNEEAAVRGII